MKKMLPEVQNLFAEMIHTRDEIQDRIYSRREEYHEHFSLISVREIANILFVRHLLVRAEANAVLEAWREAGFYEHGAGEIDLGRFKNQDYPVLRVERQALEEVHSFMRLQQLFREDLLLAEVGERIRCRYLNRPISTEREAFVHPDVSTVQEIEYCANYFLEWDGEDLRVKCSWKEERPGEISIRKVEKPSPLKVALTRVWTDEEFAEELVRRLNELIEYDLDVKNDVGALLQVKIPCSKVTAEHPSIPVTDGPKLSPLGLLNALGGALPESAGEFAGWGRIAAVIETEGDFQRLVRFDDMSKENGRLRPVETPLKKPDPR